MLFESLLSNNVGFNSLNEVITFINNVEHEKGSRKFVDYMILDGDISIDQVFYKLMMTVDYSNVWVPTEREMSLVWDYLSGLSQEDLNRLYYKNNIYEFCNNETITDLIKKIFVTMENPFMDPGKPPKEIQELLDSFYELIKEYVYYGHFYIDKIDRIDYMQRDIVCISDTDSTIISFDAWYRFILDKVYNIDMPIKHKKYDMCEIIEADEFGDMPPRSMCEIVEPVYDYNFYTDESIEIHREREMCVLAPYENLRYAIINIMAYICNNLVVDYLERYTKLTGSYVEGVKCRMVIILVVTLYW